MSRSVESPTPGPRVHALIAAGGAGTRAGGDRPKQYQSVAGQPMLQRTLAAFEAVEGLAHLIVLVSPDDRHAAKLPAGRHRLVPRAGQTRAQTVRNGLDELAGRMGAALSDWVLVHDAARCLVTPDLIQRLIGQCRDHPVGGLLAMPLADTLKLGDGQHVRETVSRADKWLAQTPQMFRIGVLRDALDAAGDAVTDESSAVEALGLHPLLVQGGAHNIKITWPEDFSLADAWLRARAPEATAT